MTRSSPAAGQWPTAEVKDKKPVRFLAKPHPQHFNYSFPICKTPFQHDTSRQL